MIRFLGSAMNLYSICEYFYHQLILFFEMIVLFNKNQIILDDVKQYLKDELIIKFSHFYWSDRLVICLENSNHNLKINENIFQSKILTQNF